MDLCVGPEPAREPCLALLPTAMGYRIARRTGHSGVPPRGPCGLPPQHVGIVFPGNPAALPAADGATHPGGEADHDRSVVRAWRADFVISHPPIVNHSRGR